MKVSVATPTVAGWRIPPQLAIGILLLAIAWPLAWFGTTRQSQFTFFPIWLGYVLSVDGLVFIRSGSSLLSRSRKMFLGMFAASIPLWWFFEIANHFLDNWTYIIPYHYSFIFEKFVGSLSFSTVIPAIFVTSEFVATTRYGQREWRLFSIAPSNRTLAMTSAGGLTIFVLSLAVPDVFFPLVWVGLFLALDPINCLAGYPSIAKQVAHNNWRTVYVLFAAGLICGFFWEMWNYWSAMKWVYDVPHADRFKVFEMPLLGYGGYLPFALEVYAIYHFVRLIIGKPERGFLRFDKEPAPSGSVVDPHLRGNL